MGDDRKRINIMSSCDEKLAEYIFVQLRTMYIHLRDKEIYFYLFYSQISEEILDKLEDYCRYLGNITFYRVLIEEVEPYIKINDNMVSKKNRCKFWSYPPEAYFSLECHRYLPKEVDRILYIDAGDILFTGGIDEYYFHDFEENSLIVHPTILKSDKNYINSNDLSNENFAESIKQGIFNSGSYVINVEKFRIDNTPMHKFVELSEMIEENKESGYRWYLIDQGFLSIAFINRLKYFKFDEIQNVMYQQYNYTLDLAFKFSQVTKESEKLWYDPKIIHFVGSPIKPWRLIGVLEKEGVVTEGEDLQSILEKAAMIKQGDFKYERIIEPEKNAIEYAMIPFYEYWHGINEIVKGEIEKLFQEENKEEKE